LDFGTFVPSPWQGTLWGTLPVLSSLLAIFAVAFLPGSRRVRETLEFPTPAGEPVLREAK